MDQPPSAPRTTSIRPRETPPDLSTVDPATPPKPKLRSQSNVRINIRSACLACRRRRSKCSGGQPCNRCAALSTECEYNESQDGRTRALRDKGQQEFELHKKIVYGLFRAIRENNQQGLVSLIRDNASLDDIANVIDQHEQSTASQYLALPTADMLPPTAAGETMPGDEYDVSYATFDLEADPDLQASDFDHPGRVIDMLSPLVENPEFGNIMMDPTFQVEKIQQMMEPIHIEDSGPTHHLSGLYVTFRDTGRHLIQLGVPLDTVLDGSNVPCGFLWSNGRVSVGVATSACVIVNQVHGLDEFFRLAWLCYITRYLRWAIHQSSAYWEQVPAAMVLTHLQLTTPHLPLIDLIPLPQIRDLMITSNRDFIGALQNAGATVDWSGGLDTALEQDSSTGRLIVSTRFEQHISDPKNFRFGKNFLHTFPELEGQLNIANAGRILPNATSGPSQ